MKRFLIVVVGIVLIAGLAVGGWQGGWWLKSNAVSRSAHIYQHSYGAQSADEQEAQNLIAQVATIQTEIADPSTPKSEVTALRSQQAAIVTQACGLIANIDSPTSDVAQFASANCQ